MIDITYGPNAAFLNVNMSFEKMYEIMTDCFVEPDTFIKLTFDDGLHGAIRKKRHYCIYRSRRGGKKIMAVSTINIAIICLTIATLKMIDKTKKG